MSQVKERIIHLIRHGETDWNIGNRMLSHTDIPLNRNGRKQATLLTQTLSDLPFDVVVSSDLSRALETARIVKGDRQIRIITTPQLREKDYGELEGLTVAEVAAMNLEITGQSMEQAFAAKHHPSMESDQEVAARALSYLSESWLEQYTSILAVTHSGVIRSLLIATRYADYNTLRHGAIGNCAHAVLSVMNEQFTFLELTGVSLKGKYVEN
ncbi:MAG: histidine phosphatase family protein [bacterium]